jgi:FSR family fosmidomycin resistance protein-like MFS transporter
MNQQKRTLTTCCAAHTVHDGFSDVTYVLLPLLAQTFGLSLAQVGMIRSAHRVAMAAFQIPAGLIAERFGERNLLALGTLIAGLAFLALGYAAGFWAILIALFFAGVGSAVQHPLSSTIISHAYPGDGRRGALGTYNFFGDVGKFAFGGIVSLLLFAGISWQAPVIGFGVAGIVIAVAIFMTVNNTQSTKPQAGFLTFIAFVLLAKGMPEGWAVLSVPLILVGGMAGKLACGFLAERFGIVRMIILTEVATGLGILATLALPGTWSFLLLPVIGVVLNGTSSVLYATIGDFVEQDRLARAFGFFYTLGSLCGIAAPLGYGLIGDLYGVETSMAVIGVAIFLTVPLAAFLKPAGELKPVTR